MNHPKPHIYLCRHGQTEWSLLGRHTGLTDLPLTEKGIEEARALSLKLKDRSFAQVWTSPLKRAQMTSEHAGYKEVAQIEQDLVEWDYGDYEGLTSEEIRQQTPDWTVFRYGASGGESLDSMQKRVDRILEKIERVNGDLLIFSHGHFLRVLIASWLGLGVKNGACFVLKTASLSILGYEREQRVVQRLNDGGGE